MAFLWVYLYLGLVAFLVASALIPWCRKLSGRFEIVDSPGPRKNHKSPIPLLGGAAIFLSFNAVLFGHIAAGNLMSRSAWLSEALPKLVRFRMVSATGFVPQLVAISGCGLCFFLVGLLDDKRALSVRGRFLLEFLAVGTLIIAGVRFDLGFLPVWLAMVVSALWIVGIANAFNLLDGLDGLAGGVTVICSGILVAVLIHGGQPMVAMYVAVLAGSAAGFLRHNLFPAKIFMGSSGSLFLGYTLSVAVVLASFTIPGTSGAFPILMPLLLLAVPLYDTTSVVLIRLRERRPIFGSDKSHTHHRLLSAGFSQKWAVVFIWLLTFMVGISSVLLVSADLWSSILIFVQVALAFALIVLVKHVRLRNSTGADEACSEAPLVSPDVRATDSAGKTAEGDSRVMKD